MHIFKKKIIKKLLKNSVQIIINNIINLMLLNVPDIFLFAILFIIPYTCLNFKIEMYQNIRYWSILRKNFILVESSAVYDRLLSNSNIIICYDLAYYEIYEYLAIVGFYIFKSVIAYYSFYLRVIN